MLNRIAAAITPPNVQFEKTTPAPDPAITATVAPMSTATRISRQIERTVFDWVSWLVASARTVTASVCVPALPPIEATIGISAASATIVSMAAPNWR
jgi:hypothetical protein